MDYSDLTVQTERPAMAWRYPLGLLASSAAGFLLACCLLAMDSEQAPVQVQDLSPTVLAAGDAQDVQPLAFAAISRKWFRWDYMWSLIGRVLLVLLFLGAAVQLGFSGFIGLAKHYDLPMPSVMGVLGEILVGLGALMVLFGPFIPSRRVTLWGTDMLILFMLISTYVGHIRPLSTSVGEAKEDHRRHMLKNFSILGALIMLHTAVAHYWWEV